jgi:hypothetical protein
MWQSRHQSLVIVAILLLALGTTAGGFWWLCTRNNGIAFLPTRPGAEWIVYPKPPENNVHHAVPIRAIFRYTFVLNTPPDNATLTVRAFKSAAVVINGQKPVNLELAGENWKSPATTDVTGLLRAGTNDITAYVTNVLGPLPCGYGSRPATCPKARMSVGRCHSRVQPGRRRAVPRSRQPFDRGIRFMEASGQWIR